MSLDSELKQFSDLCDQRVRIEMNRFARCYCVIYDFPLVISKSNPSIDFIPKFLEQSGYAIFEEKSGQKFDHGRNHLKLYAKSTQDIDFKIFVKLNMKFGGHSDVNYQGPDLSKLSIANELVREILKNYAQQ